MNTAYFSALVHTEIASLLLLLGWAGVLRMALRYGGMVALFSLVGTLCHELSHLIVGLLLGAKPVSFSIWPKRQGNTWVLGYVGFTNLNLFNAAPVAFAPLLLAGLAWLIFHEWTSPALVAGQYVSWLLSGYVLTACLFSSIPSQTDFKVGAVSGLAYGLLALMIWAPSL